MLRYRRQQLIEFDRHMVLLAIAKEATAEQHMPHKDKFLKHIKKLILK